MADLKQDMIHAATRYHRRLRGARASGLALMFAQVDEAHARIMAGEPARPVLEHCFNDRLLDAMLKVAGCA